MPKKPIDVINQAVEKQPKTKRKGCFSRAGKIFFLLLLIAAVWMIWSFQSVPLQISPETTLITEPRTADGKWIDYFAAYEQKYYPPEMKTDDNGYRLIAKNLGVPKYHMNVNTNVPIDTKALQRQAYEKLGLDPNTKPRLTYQDPSSFLADYVKKQFPDIPDDKNHQKINEYELYRRTNTSWTLDDLPMMKEWLEKNNPALDVIVEAVSQPVFCPPLVLPDDRDKVERWISDFQLEQIQTYRSYARGLQTRIFYHLGTANIDAAIRDKIAIKRLSQRIGQESTVSFLVGIAVDGISAAAGIAENPDAQPTAEQIRVLMRQLDELPDSINMKEAMEQERFEVLNNLQNIARNAYGVIQGNDDLKSHWMYGVGQDWNLVFRRFNQYYDDYLDGTLEPPPITHTNLLNSHLPPRIMSWFLSRKTRSETFADVLFQLFFSTIEATQKAVDREECFNHLQKITLAMLLYHAEHGELPPAYTTNANGEPLQSWRVLLLPYLGEEELYKQIRLDEAWNSEHNCRFHEKMPTVYSCPSLKHKMKSDETNYTVIVGNETPFDRSGQGKKLSDFGSECADMVLITETRMPGCWMNPNFDVSFEDAKQGINGKPDAPKAIGSEHVGGCNNGLRSGGVMFFSENIEPSLWENLLKGTERMKW
jgi:hypothetical protein